MNELIIIAGPQAAGKSTAIAKLCEQYQSIAPLFGGKRTPLIFPLQESRQIIVHMHMLLGGIFMKPEHELEVVSCDFARMNTIEERRNGRIVYLDECNIFTLAHAAAHGIDQIWSNWHSYISRLERLHAKVIFLNIPPSWSWDRRKRKYEQRLVYFPKKDRAKIWSKYERYLNDVYPLLLQTYDRLPLPKQMIDATQPAKTVQALISQSLSELSTAFR